MRSVTPGRTRSVLVSAAAFLLVATAGACDAGEDIRGDRESPEAPADGATETPSVTTATTLQNVGTRLDDGHRERLKAAITDVVDPWLDEAFLGDFPRADYAAAFARFTPGAAEDAQRDLDLLTNAAIADQIDSATATRRRVRADVFAVDGHPRGVTAHVVLEFETAGGLEQTMRVRGDLYLVKEKGTWSVFGYDVDQAEAL